MPGHELPLPGRVDGVPESRVGRGPAVSVAGKDPTCSHGCKLRGGVGVVGQGNDRRVAINEFHRGLGVIRGGPEILHAGELKHGLADAVGGPPNLSGATARNRDCRGTL